MATECLEPSPHHRQSTIIIIIVVVTVIIIGLISISPHPQGRRHRFSTQTWVGRFKITVFLSFDGETSFLEKPYRLISRN